MRATTCLLAVTLVACAAGDATLDPIELQEPTGAVTLVREATTSEAGGYDLFVPTRPTPLNGGVWLLESSNDQIVRYDSTLSQARTFARSGQGPGELEYAQDLLHRGDELIVAETGNGRLSIFDTTGAFRRIVTTVPVASYSVIASTDWSSTNSSPVSLVVM